MKLPTMKHDVVKNKKAGLPPGMVVYVGRAYDHEVVVDVIDYRDEFYVEHKHVALDDVSHYRESDTVSWINVNGVHDIEIVKDLGKIFDLDHLILEDIVNTNHRPKMEDHERHLFFTFKMLTLDKHTHEIGSEQVSMVVGDGFVISFQETPQDVFDPVRQRIESKLGRIRYRGADYLVYALIDAVVDKYFHVVEMYDSLILDLEERANTNPQESDIATIQKTKKQLLFLRRALRPLQESINLIQNSENPLIEGRHLKYYNDVHDHLLQLIDSLELNRSLLDSVHDSLQANISNRMNQVMKILTVMSTIFIPLTFIAGIYGMNFTHMPELAWKWSYPIVWGVMLTATLGMIIFFKRSKWL